MEAVIEVRAVGNRREIYRRKEKEMGKPNIITTEGGEEIVILSRRDYDALLARSGDPAAEDAVTARIIAESDKVLASGAEVALPETVFEEIEAGGNPVRVLRAFRGLTQAALAAQTGISQSYLSDMEAGRKAGTAATLKSLAAALGVPVDMLIE